MGDVLSLIEEARRRRSTSRKPTSSREDEVGQGLRPRRLQGADRRRCARWAALRRCSTSCRRELARARRARNVDERKIARVEGIINSMTPGERAKPEILKASRKRPDRHGRRRLRAGGQPAAQSVRAGAENDENDGQGRDAEDAAGNEGLHAAGALSWRDGRRHNVGLHVLALAGLRVACPRQGRRRHTAASYQAPAGCPPRPRRCLPSPGDPSYNQKLSIALARL